MLSNLSRACILSVFMSHAASVHAEATDPPPGTLSDWRRANDAVGQFPRGHIDLLQWESRHLTDSLSRTPAVALPVLTLTDAIVAAKRTRPDLLAQPGLNPTERGQLWLKQRELALTVERAWLQAIAAQQTVATLRQTLRAMKAGHELAVRMVRVGNWPQAEEHRQTLALMEAEFALQTAEHDALSAALALWQLTGLDEAPETLAARLPRELPAPPEALTSTSLAELTRLALESHPDWTRHRIEAERARRAVADSDAMESMWQQLTAPDAQTGQPQPLPQRPLGTRWPHNWQEALKASAEWQALDRQIRGDVQRAHHRWTLSRQFAEARAPEMLQRFTALEEDMIQRYNGMFKSTWDVLAAARTRIEATQAVQQARLNASLALADLRAVLDGLPYTGGPLGSTAPQAASADKGH